MKNKIIFIDGNFSQFDDYILRYIEDQKIQPYVLKVGNSRNYQPYDNGPNAKRKSHYNDEKESWMLNYGRDCFYLSTRNKYWWKNGAL